MDVLAGDTGPWLAGLLIDLTELRLSATRAATEHAVAEALRHRAVIEQAKGIVMVVYRVDADTGFHLLRRHSQNTNTKLHELADRLVAQVPDLSFDPVPAHIEALFNPPTYGERAATFAGRVPGLNPAAPAPGPGYRCGGAAGSDRRGQGCPSPGRLTTPGKATTRSDSPSRERCGLRQSDHCPAVWSTLLPVRGPWVCLKPATFLSDVQIGGVAADGGI